MIELTRILINDTTAISGARNRIRFLAEDLKFGHMGAIRLATISSDLCRSLYQSGDNASLILGFEKREQGFGLLLIFEGSTEALTVEDSVRFFDQAGLLSAEKESPRFAAFKYIPDSEFEPTVNFVNSQRERLTHLSKTELLIELQRKNEKLEALLDELKLRSEREKKLAAAAAVAEVERKKSQELTRAYNELEKVRESEQQLANYDTVTGLPNRMFFHDRLQQAITYAKRNEKRLAVLFLDLDHFKNVNDTVGHAEGDRLLRIVAERLLDCVRSSDTVARLGGDEFTLVLLDIAGPEAVAAVADNILKKLVQPYMLAGREFFIGVSIGISIYPNDAENIELLLSNADTAMYKVKQSGRKNYQFYTSDMGDEGLFRLELENSLRKAIKQGELELYYQPQIDCVNRQIVSMEALIRWQHPEQGFIAPDKFIPLAEESGLILEIGEWVLKTACMQNKAWQNAGYAPIPIAVNLSMRHFEKNDLVDEVKQVLDETGLAPEWLELELTEGVFLHKVERATAMLTTLRELGIVISIDDFGTGYSSLSQLRHLPVDSIKVDRSFIRGIASDKDDADIVTAIIGLAHNLNLKVVAEGVETEAQLDFLREHACDLWQGYLFSKALPASDFELLLRSQAANSG